jgi:beta-galactosidase
MNIRPLLLSTLALLGLDCSAAPRERELFTADWRFIRDDPADASAGSLSYDKLKPWQLAASAAFRAEPPADPPAGPAPGESVSYASPGFDDASWRGLTLPHDWGVEGAFDQALPGETGKLPWHGVAWYRKTFDLPASDASRRIVLEIDGAMSYSAVWCNGRLVGGWPYGYASYQLDLTQFLKPGASNTLAIRLDNPKNSSRWYPGGGIYRNVWLTKTDPIHVAQWGVVVTTPEVSANSATVSVKAEIANASKSSVHGVRVATQLFKADTNGHPVGTPLASSAPEALDLTAGSSASITALLTLAKPALWDIASPERHVAVVLVQQDGKLIDRHETPFGIRSTAFTADDGFHLNGKRIPLQGVCMHHDLGALGAAFNTRAAERQLEILKEMGVNAVRISHNPPAPEYLDLCDRMGILVIDEFTDTWTVKKKPNGYAILFADWSEADWRTIIRRDRNHPSVIAWSTGNEIGELRKPELQHISTRLTAIAHEEDPTRPTTVGSDFPASGHNGFQKTVDVFGYNYKPHEYGKFHTANPTQPLYGSETASTISSRGEYLFPVDDRKDGGKVGFQMSSYDLYAPGWACAPDVEFRGQDENPVVAGEFVWTGFDYIGEPTPFNSDVTVLSNFHTPEALAKAKAELEAVGKIAVPSRSSYFGIVDLAGFKKDRFYLYQSRWRPDLPMAHILPHWNWPERVGQVTPVHVYTSGDQAELFLNGKSLGRKTKGKFEYRLRWDDVVYAPGELKVVAYKNGKSWADATVKTTGPAAKLLLSADRTQIVPDGRDLTFVTATVADAMGLLVPRTKPALKFTVEGPGEIVATDNGDATDHTAFTSAERKAFNGLGLALVRLKPGASTPVKLRVSSDNLAPAEVTILPAAR